jgi:hypothetical protein
MTVTKSISTSKSSRKSGASLFVSPLQNNILVEWNTENLLSLLKHIVAQCKGIKPSPMSIPARDAFGLPSDQTFANEVAEIIHLPRAVHASPDLYYRRKVWLLVTKSLQSSGS